MQHSGIGAPSPTRAVPGGDLYDLVNDLDAIIWEFDAATMRFTFVSQRAEDLLGYPVELWYAAPDFWATHLLHPEDRGWASDSLQRIVEGGAGSTFEWRVLTASGAVLWGRHLVRSIEAEEGRVLFRGITLDITEEKCSEQRSREDEGHFRSVIENVSDIVAVIDRGRKFRYVSPATERILGYTAAEVVGRSPLDFVHPDDAAYLEERMASRFRGGGEPEALTEVRFRHRDGSWRILQVRGRLNALDPGEEVIVLTARDITERRRAEEELRRQRTYRKRAEKALAESEAQLRQAQKMEAIGRLAGGVAHDFNNVLTAIKGHAQLLLDEMCDSEPRREDAEEIWRSAERAAGLTRQLLAFSRKQILKPVPVDLNGIISGLEKMLERLVGEEVVFAMALSHDLGRVLADPGQIGQVIMNLVVNASDAMPGGGLLTVMTLNTELGEGCTTDFGYPVRPGPYVVLLVQDTGRGMTPGVRDQIFEPFFTTKARGRGTGLGLSTVLGIVQQTGGHIRVASGEGEGTSFEVYLPRMEVEAVLPESEPEQRPEMVCAAADLEPVTETILVVEDDDAVRSLICKVLRKRGYSVLEAGNGADALRVLTTHDDEIHLVVTDLVMPGMSGTELAAELWNSHPGLPFLFMSGYTEDELVRRGVADGEMLLLEKPFSPGRLTQRIREVLVAERVC
jgi:PAS domain S-box-containing protein